MTFNLSSNWLSYPFNIVTLIDDSWSVGPIDFSRQVDFTKMVLSGLNQSTQKSAVLLYSKGLHKNKYK